MTLSDGWPPFYGERQSSALVDINQLYLAFVTTALLFAFFLILPGVRGLERFFFLLRWTTSIIIGGAIVACGQGISWQVANIDAQFRHNVADNNLTQFNLGLRIGLTHFNVTLKGNPGSGVMLNEKFLYLTVDESIENSLRKGVPFPILTVAEHFSSTRFHSLWPWGRKYWQAGHYASYLLWTAFVSWFITNVLFNMVLQYGSMFLILTGVLLLLADISFSSVSYGGNLRIHVGYDDPKIMDTSFGWCFWLSVAIGLACVFLGTIALIFARNGKTYLEKFFMHKDENREPSYIPKKPEETRISTMGLDNTGFVEVIDEDAEMKSLDRNHNESVENITEDGEEGDAELVENVENSETVKSDVIQTGAGHGVKHRPNHPMYRHTNL